MVLLPVGFIGQCKLIQFTGGLYYFSPGIIRIQDLKCRDLVTIRTGQVKIMPVTGQPIIARPYSCPVPILILLFRSKVFNVPPCASRYEAFTIGTTGVEYLH